VLNSTRERTSFGLRPETQGRPNREAFKPHSYEVSAKTISVSAVRKESLFDIGSKIKELRTRIGMSQKELAERVDLTPSFISQLESNQIVPSLNSFIQICNTLGVSLSETLEKRTDDFVAYKEREDIFNPVFKESGLKGYGVIKDGTMSCTLVVIEPYAKVKSQFIPAEGRKLMYVLRGDVSLNIDGKGEVLRAGDSVYLKDEVPSLLKNEGGDSAEILVLSS
jgi:transcriptional regulator with XRE-family HTH domain